MPRDPDAFELLRAADPVDEAALPTHDSPQAQRALAEILATPRETTARETTAVTGLRWSRRRVTAAVAVGFAALAAIAAGTLLLRPVSEPVGIACYDAPSLDAGRTAAASGVSADPVQACGDFWLDGTIANPAVSPVGVVPPLVACVDDVGSLSVFPTDDPDACQRLGLAVPEPDSLPGAEVVRAVNDRLVAYFAGVDCAGLADATVEVRRILDEAGLAGWSIEAGPPTAERPCASFGLDAENQIVVLVPIPRPAGG